MPWQKSDQKLWATSTAQILIDGMNQLARTKLPRAFYLRDDVVEIARDLIGKYLFTDLGGLTGGRIVETEAYCGRGDRACHSHSGRRTARTEVMFGEGGHAYVYLCYGIHSLFNIVTNRQGQADAVLVRAIEPTQGKKLMMLRRGLTELERRLTAGPGTMAQALGISRELKGADLTGPEIWLENRGKLRESIEIIASPRVGVDYAGEDALLPWRFREAKEGIPNAWCSRAK